MDYDTKTRKYRHQEYAGRIAAVQDCLCALVQRFCLNAECLNWGACGGISRSGFCRWDPSATIAVMIFIFGAGVGANRMILDNLGSIGIPAVVIAVSGIVGSLVAACGYDRLFGKKGGGK